MDYLGHVGFIHEGVAGARNRWRESLTRFVNHNRHWERSSAGPQVSLLVDSFSALQNPDVSPWLRLMAVISRT